MKKLIALLIMFSVSSGYCVTQARSLGNVKMSKASIDTQTLAQIGALVPDTTGQLIECADCVQSAICVSSGSTTAGQWVILTATGTFNGSTWQGFQHCR